MNCERKTHKTTMYIGRVISEKRVGLKNRKYIIVCKDTLFSVMHAFLLVVKRGKDIFFYKKEKTPCLHDLQEKKKRKRKEKRKLEYTRSLRIREANNTRPLIPFSYCD